MYREVIRVSIVLLCLFALVYLIEREAEPKRSRTDSCLSCFIKQPQSSKTYM